MVTLVEEKSDSAIGAFFADIRGHAGNSPFPVPSPLHERSGYPIIPDDPNQIFASAHACFIQHLFRRI
jgi:hypothetical protein